MSACLALYTTVEMNSTEISLLKSPTDLREKKEGIIIISDPYWHVKAFRKARHRCGEKAAGFARCIAVNLPPAVIGQQCKDTRTADTEMSRDVGEENPGCGQREGGPLDLRFKRFCSQMIVRMEISRILLKSSGSKGRGTRMGNVPLPHFWW